MQAVGKCEVAYRAVDHSFERSFTAGDLVEQLRRRSGCAEVGMAAGVAADLDAGGGQFANFGSAYSARAVAAISHRAEMA